MKVSALKTTGLTLATLWLSAISLPAGASVVTSVRPLGFIAAAIADGVTDTEVLLPDGASPHDYALRPSDVLKVRQADLLVWVGPELEAFMAKSAAGLSAERNLSLVAEPGIVPLLQTGASDTHDAPEPTSDHDKAQDDNHHHGQYNLHIWLSPAIAEQAARAIHDRLVLLMPDKKQQLDANLHFFSAALTKNDKNIATMLAPVSGKRYFVFHDAYGYFEKHYGLSSLGYFTINPEIQPGAQALHNIRTQLVEQNVTCIFAEPQFRPAVINAVARGTKVHTGTLDPLGSGIALDKESYFTFLSQLSSQYVSCLKKNS